MFCDIYTNNMKNRFLTASGLPQHFCSHSRPLRASSLRSPAFLTNSPPDCLSVSAASRQWSLAPNKNAEDPSCQIPDSSSCLCITDSGKMFLHLDYLDRGFIRQYGLLFGDSVPSFCKVKRKA